MLKSNKSPNKKQNNEYSPKVPDNILDSSAPSKKRGKERLVPKVKKPTQMKKIIIQEKSSQNQNQNIVNEGTSNEENNGDDNQDLNPIETTQNILHNTRYREYCNQAITKEINDLIKLILQKLAYFQDRMHAKDPQKAKIKKRLSFGFREVSKFAEINKLKAVIIAPDIEKIQSKGGLDDAVDNLLQLMNINNVPVIFGLNRFKLGIVCKKKGRVSCVGILNYDGAQDDFKKLLSLCEEARSVYNSICEELTNKLKECSLNNVSSSQYDELKNLSNKLFINKDNSVKKEDK